VTDTSGILYKYTHRQGIQLGEKKKKIKRKASLYALVNSVADPDPHGIASN
jgi:hypothetical protein